MKSSNTKFNCPVEYTLSVLDGKWKTVILAWIKENPCRYNELKKKIPNISDKVLTQRLKDLEKSDLIVKTEQIDRSNRKAYHLTNFGETLRPVLDALYDWGEKTELQSSETHYK